jgi:hypothetical protein
VEERGEIVEPGRVVRRHSQADRWRWSIAAMYQRRAWVLCTGKAQTTWGEQQ